MCRERGKNNQTKKTCTVESSNRQKASWGTKNSGVGCRNFRHIAVAKAQLASNATHTARCWRRCTLNNWQRANNIAAVLACHFLGGSYSAIGCQCGHNLIELCDLSIIETWSFSILHQPLMFDRLETVTLVLNCSLKGRFLVHGKETWMAGSLCVHLYIIRNQVLCSMRGNGLVQKEPRLSNTEEGGSRSSCWHTNPFSTHLVLPEWKPAPAEHSYLPVPVDTGGIIMVYGFPNYNNCLHSSAVEILCASRFEDAFRNFSDECHWEELWRIEFVIPANHRISFS